MPRFRTVVPALAALLLAVRTAAQESRPGPAAEMEALSAEELFTRWLRARDPAGRAFVAGYPGGQRPPRALVVESAGPGGTPTRVEVPASAFEAVMERLLMPWTGLEEEPAQAPGEP